MTTLTTAQLVAEYNAAAEYLGIPFVKKFQDRKTAERRHAEVIARAEALQAQTEPAAPATGNEEVPAPTAKEKSKARRAKKVHAPKAPGVTEEKTLPLLVAFLQAGALKDQKPATTLRAALETFSSATRIQFKHSAIAAGFNGLTARNLFDRINKK